MGQRLSLQEKRRYQAVKLFQGLRSLVNPRPRGGFCFTINIIGIIGPVKIEIMRTAAYLRAVITHIWGLF